MAHIEPNSEGGDVSSENLILLCRNCHKEIDDNRTASTATSLRKWKSDRETDIQQKFAFQCSSFQELSSHVVPFLKKNGAIFASYGPIGNNGATDSVKHDLWVKKQFEIVSNNRNLELWLSRNSKLLHYENREIVDEFISHAREFAETRSHEPIQRVNLFPIALLSIFGLEQDISYKPIPSVNPLQNFIKLLKSESKFVELKLIPQQFLTYREHERELKLNLADRPKVQQIFWNERMYWPKSTELRLENLVYFLKWLSKNHIQFKFGDITDLTSLILNDRFKVKLFYEYCLSLESLYGIEAEENLFVVNLYNWNGGPISKKAEEYAKDVGITLFNQNQFFSFAHKEIK